jgi:predicted ABC-type ATPase
VPRGSKKPRCIVIAGPNGAGKTTFARTYLPQVGRIVRFVNADLIAGGLSPLKPELAAIAAARLVLREIERLAAERQDFAFESTMSGLTYLRRYTRGWENFQNAYRDVADSWTVYDNSGASPRPLEQGP